MKHLVGSHLMRMFARLDCKTFVLSIAKMGILLFSLIQKKITLGFMTTRINKSGYLVKYKYLKKGESKYRVSNVHEVKSLYELDIFIENVEKNPDYNEIHFTWTKQVSTHEQFPPLCYN